MIKEIIMFSIVCDNCGKDANEGAESIAWESKESAWYVANMSDWVEVDDKHYCPDCVSYDDEDNLILKEIDK